MRIVMDAEDADLIVFEFDLVMFRVHDCRIEFGNRRGTRRLALQVDLQNSDGAIADVFGDIGAARGTPTDLAAMKFDFLKVFAVARIAAILPRHHAVIEINQYAIGRVTGSRRHGSMGSESRNI